MSEIPVDIQYESVGPEIAHKYGENVHILNDITLLNALAILGMKETKQPAVTRLIRSCYQMLINYVINKEFKKTTVQVPTAMQQYELERGIYRGPVIDPNQYVVSVNLMRAGMVPSELTYLRFAEILGGENVVQHHLNISRVVNKNNEIVGADISGSKIDHISFKKYFLVFSDPMGATGASIHQAIEFYRNKIGNPEGIIFPSPEKIIVIHLVITPDAIKSIKKYHPDVKIYAARLDRGLSTPEILITIPGTHIDKETGLTERGYIVPGLGGVGERINNTTR